MRINSRTEPGKGAAAVMCPSVINSKPFPSKRQRCLLPDVERKDMGQRAQTQQLDPTGIWQSHAGNAPAWGRLQRAEEPLGAWSPAGLMQKPLRLQLLWNNTSSCNASLGPGTQQLCSASREGTPSSIPHLEASLSTLKFKKE